MLNQACIIFVVTPLVVGTSLPKKFSLKLRTSGTRHPSRLNLLPLKIIRPPQHGRYIRCWIVGKFRALLISKNLTGVMALAKHSHCYEASLGPQFEVLVN
jgi:hypothetical protein